MKNDMISVPVSATYRVVDGQVICLHAEYAEISADMFARFLIQKFGKTPYLKEGDEE
ncbi:MAG: hypothetical protein HFJ84_01205 [Clostridiales bacterium]|jgi:hypothetical protein|nr:hypothetical protein [Clostridiales bacterium]